MTIPRLDTECGVKLELQSSRLIFLTRDHALSERSED